MKKIILSSILFLGVIPSLEAAAVTLYKYATLGGNIILMLNAITCGAAGVLFLENLTKDRYSDSLVVKYLFCGIFIVVLNKVSSTMVGEVNNTRMLSIICLFAYYLYVIYVFKNPDDVVKSINITLLVLIVASLVLYYTNPEKTTYIENATTRYFKGVSANRNSYAEITLLYISNCIYLFKKEKKHKLFYLLTICIAVYTTFMTHSATSIVCVILLIVLSVIYAVTKKTIPFGAFAGIYIFVFASLVILQSNNIPFLAEIAKYFNKNISMTGRTDIWTTSVKIIKDNLFFGRGFDTFALARKGIYENDPHNSILYTLLTQGICGFVILTVMFFKPVIKARNAVKNNDLFEHMYIFVMVWMVRGLTESTWSYSHFTFWLAVIIIEMLTAKEDVTNAKKIQ